MADAAGNTGLDQIAARRGVVEIIGEGIFDRLRDHQTAGEVNHARDLVGLDHPLHPGDVANVTFYKHDVRWDRIAVTGREVINDDHIISGLKKRQDRMASDVAGATSNQDGHELNRDFFGSEQLQAEQVIANSRNSSAL